MSNLLSDSTVMTREVPVATAVGQLNRPRRTRNALLAMCFVALLLRVCVAAFLYKEFVNPSRGYWTFGWETGRVARSIAAGHGFSSPLFGDTGPTAIMTPLYPYLVAGVFKLLGTYSAASAFAILFLNSLFSAAICIPVFLIAKEFFGRRVASWAGWAWAVFPYAIYFSAGRIWVTALATLLLTLGLLATLRLTPRARLHTWILYGILWGLNGLANPANLAVLPFLAAWLMYRFRDQGWRWLWSGVLSAVIFTAISTPWFVRNYRTFGRFMPFRDNFWYELWAGNTGDSSDLVPDWARPSNNQHQMEEFRSMGELPYYDSKKPLVEEFITHHPGIFAWVTCKRIVFTWTGFWSFDRRYMAEEPFEIPNTVFCTALSILAFIGLLFAFRQNKLAATFFAMVLFSIPLLYYITHPDLEYRHVIDPEIVILATFAVAQLRGREKGILPRAV